MRHTKCIRMEVSHWITYHHLLIESHLFKKLLEEELRFWTITDAKFLH